VESPTRRWKRFKVDFRVKLQRQDSAKREVLVVRTFELSEGGMSVYASEELELGAQALAELVLPGKSKVMRLRAVVRNRRGFRCGLEFVDITTSERAEISRYLSTLADVIEI
jgi:c-di-GMP-binding flagellar brake protein YcgR